MSGVRGKDASLQLADLKMSLFSRGKKRRQQDRTERSKRVDKD